mgnify:CR=1 FL=1
MSMQDISIAGVGLIVIEIVFWLVVVKWVYKRRKAKKSIWNKEP